MGTSVSLNGTSYTIPSTGESGWGDAVSNYLIALATGVLSKAGGSFTLTAEVDFGATYGLKSAYYKSRATNPAGAGIVRLGNAEVISWRNAANSANLDLTVSASNVLTFNSAPILTLALGAASTVLAMDSGGTAYEWVTSTGTGNIARATSPTFVTPTLGAATATSVNGLTITSSTGTLTVTNGKTLAASNTLTLTGTDGSTAAFGTGGTVAYQGGTLAQFAATTSAQLAGVVSDETGSGSLVFATSPTLVTPVLGTPSSGTLTSCTGLPLTTGVTGTLPIANGGTGQTTKTAAFDALAPTTTKGDLIVSDGSDNVRLAVGSDGQVLTAASGQTSGLQWTSPLTNPMDSAGDLIVGGASGAATKLDSGTSGQILMAQGAAAPAWVNTITTGKVIDGTADENQLRVQGHSSQTSDIFVVENSAGTDFLAVQGDGDVQFDAGGLHYDATNNRLGINTTDTAVAGLHSLITSTSLPAALFRNTSTSLAGAVARFDTDHATGTSTLRFWEGRINVGVSADVKARVDSDGTFRSDSSYETSGADYAEYFEWIDGNPTGEDRVGMSVVLEGEKIRLAAPGEIPVGVISAAPSVVGDSAWGQWKGKYLRDAFGRPLRDGQGIPQLNPAFDSAAPYLGRHERKEWAPVGLFGKLCVRRGQPVAPTWILLGDVSPNVEKWLVR